MPRVERLPWRAAATPLAAVLLALVFLATGLGKALDIEGFAVVLRAYRVFPEAALLPLALLITAAEFVVAGALLLPRWRRRGAVAAGALALGNATLLGVTLWRGIELRNCGCFGVFLARPLTIVTPLEDAALLGFALLVAIRSGVRA